MTPRMLSGACLPAAIVMLFFTKGSVGNTCDDVLSTLGNLKACNDLNQLAIKAGQEAANSDCEGARTIGRKYFNTMPPECCEPLRVMVEQGCVCDLEFQQTSAGLQDIPDEQLPSTFQGMVKLLQASTCTLPENGGPMANPCPGFVNVCAASSRKLLF